VSDDYVVIVGSMQYIILLCYVMICVTNDY
jgi:hypothetical protein